MDRKFGKAWKAVLTVHMILFFVTCFFTFFDHVFNEPQDAVDAYVLTLKSLDKMDEQSADITEKTVREFMKDSFERMQGKQELASQAFHIILGALLSFLSTTAARIFDDDGDKKEKER